MGAFLSGLLGAAGQDIEKQSDRRYQEKRQERLDRMRILELAASNPNTKPDALQGIFAEIDDVAKDAGYKTANKGVKDPFSQMGKMVSHILTRKQQQAGQQAGQAQGRADVQNAPGVTAQPAQPAQPGQAPQTPPMPQSRFFTQAELDALQQQKQEQALQFAGRGQRQTADIGRETGSKDFDFWYEKGNKLGLQGRDLAEYAATQGKKLPAGGGSGLSKEWVLRPGSEDPERAWVDKNNPGGGYIDMRTGERMSPETKASGAPTKERLYSAIQGYYHYWLGKGLNPKDALAKAGDDFRENQGKHLGRLEQQSAIDQALSGVGMGRGFSGQASTGAPKPTTPPVASGNVPRGTLPTTPAMPPSRVAAGGATGGAAKPSAATAPLRSTLNPKETEDVQYYLTTIMGGSKSVPRAAQVRVQNGIRALAKVTGLDPMSLSAELAEQPALAKQLGETVQREGAIQRLNATIERHGKVLEDVAAKVQQTDSPFLNRPIREWKHKAVGSPELKQFDIALNALQREYAYLTAGGAQSKAMLPVNTSAHMEKIFSNDSTLGEIMAEVAQVRREAQQEEAAMKDTREKIKGSMRSGKIGQAVGASNGANGANGTGAPKRKVYNEATGNFEDR